ncbi:MAG: hypothetical protein HYV97_00190 [Bdellovibrio sp.]|nr:hypothetical protein [Bdellovibrio sp.]
MNEIFRLSTNFTDEIIALALGLTGFLGCIIIVYWLYYRRKFHQLSHQIPASVIKNYLDSIIQNSSALKSSLFRGGGMDLPEGVPSIVPVSGLGSGPVNLGANDEAIAQKNAEISSLLARVKEKDRTLADLEARLSDALAASKSGGASNEEVQLLKKEVARLQKELAAASASSGGDAVMKAELGKVMKERDELKERLMEYEIIEEDLANLKRLQQENEQLKATIAQLKGGKVEIPAAPAVAAAPAAPAPEPTPEPEPEVELAPEPVAEPEPLAAAPVDDDLPAPAGDQKIAVPDNLPEAPVAGENEQKSAEELLSEFEKMLG